MLKVGKKSLTGFSGPQSLQDALPWTWHHCHTVQGHLSHWEPWEQPGEETQGNFVLFGALLHLCSATVMLFIPTCSISSLARVS